MVDRLMLATVVYKFLVKDLDEEQKIVHDIAKRSQGLHISYITLNDAPMGMQPEYFQQLEKLADHYRGQQQARVQPQPQPQSQQPEESEQE